MFQFFLVEKSDIAEKKISRNIISPDDVNGVYIAGLNPKKKIAIFKTPI